MPEKIHTCYASPAGTLKITGDDQYVSAILFCDAPEMESNMPLHSLPPVMQQCIRELDAYFTGTLQAFTVPVQQEGTPFQEKVWNELTRIPYGSTISYKELSKRIGDVKAIRAAASTNGRNRIAVIVPCHRVIGSNNDLVGYAGGMMKKKWLLQHESKIAFGVQTLF